MVCNAVNGHAGILANVCFPLELTDTLQSRLLLKSVRLFLCFHPWSSIFLGHLHRSETRIQGLQEDLQVWLMHRNHAVTVL